MFQGCSALLIKYLFDYSTYCRSILLAPSLTSRLCYYLAALFTIVSYPTDVGKGKYSVWTVPLRTVVAYPLLRVEIEKVEIQGVRGLPPRLLKIALEGRHGFGSSRSPGVG